MLAFIAYWAWCIGTFSHYLYTYVLTIFFTFERFFSTLESLIEPHLEVIEVISISIVGPDMLV